MSCNSKKFNVIQWRAGAHTVIRQQRLIGEAPLAIRIDGHPYSVMMRTPGDEIAHVAGFCLGEGIVDHPADMANIASCDGEQNHVVTVTLSPGRRLQAGHFLERRGFISQSSCGLCGKAVVTDLLQHIPPMKGRVNLSPETAWQCLDSLAAYQPLRKQTRAAHGVAVFDQQAQLLAVAEDVGRHNALDKAIGALFLSRTLDRASFVVLSSRISYEMVQKTARARIPIILAVSRPTSLAVDLAGGLNMTIACLSKSQGLDIFSHPKRLIGREGQTSQED